MKKLLILLLPLFMLNCGLWYSFTKKESTYYTEEEKVMLDATTAAIDFRYGFDPGLELDYVYRAGNFPDRELEGKSKKMLEALKQFDKQKVVAFFEKMFRLKETLSLRMKEAEKDEEWEDYTLLQKYILPDMEKYIEMLEKNVLLIDRDYKNTIEERKGAIKKQVESGL